MEERARGDPLSAAASQGVGVVELHGDTRHVELWTVKGGVHAPPFGPTFGPALWTFFAAHPRP